MNSAGELFPWESQYHPQEHVLQLTKEDLLALPAALRAFNRFYTVGGNFTMENSIHILIALGVLVAAAMIGLGWTLVRFTRRRKRTRQVVAHISA
jgi:hypothetical protein